MCSREPHVSAVYQQGHVPTLRWGRHFPGMQVGDVLLVMAHADSVVKGAIGRKETLLALFVVMSKLDRRERALLKCLKCLRLLTFDPALLQPLQV